MNCLFVAGLLLLWATCAQSAEPDGAILPDQQPAYRDDPAAQVTYGGVRIGHRHALVRSLRMRLSTAMVSDVRTAKVQARIPYISTKLARVGVVPIVERRFGLYGLAGYISSRPAWSYLGKPLDEGEYDLSLGAGVELLGDERNGFSLELVRQIEESPSTLPTNVDRIGLGYIRRF